jgi:signal transduction histidine kinase
VDEETLTPEDVLRILDETSQLRAHSIELEEKSESLERATAELRAANEQLKSLDRLKDDFMSSVTHELRTPLTSIRALAELMRDDPKIDLAQRRRFIDVIVSETERLSRLVNQVLDMAKIESGHAQWHTDCVDMCALINQAVTTTTELFHERQAVVNVTLPDQAPTLMADPDRLMQVLLNLLSNAAKFVPVTGGRVGVSLSSDDTGVTVVVSDNGPGVSVEQQALIFERFRQGGDAGNRPQGTGLGLPISRQIVEHFGGRLWLESRPGQGAAFCFRLPNKINEETT